MPPLHLRGGDKSTLARSIGTCRAYDAHATKCGLCEYQTAYTGKISTYPYKYVNCLLSGLANSISGLLKRIDTVLPFRCDFLHYDCGKGCANCRARW